MRRAYRVVTGMVLYDVSHQVSRNPTVGTSSTHILARFLITYMSPNLIRENSWKQWTAMKSRQRNFKQNVFLFIILLALKTIYSTCSRTNDRFHTSMGPVLYNSTVSTLLVRETCQSFWNGGYIALNRDGKVFYQTSRNAYTDHRWRPNRVEGYRYKLA